MKFNRLNIFLISILLAGLLVGCNSSASVSSSKTSDAEIEKLSSLKQVGNTVGDLSPSFDLLTIKGENISLGGTNNQNHPVFLFFFSPF